MSLIFHLEVKIIGWRFAQYLQLVDLIVESKYFDKTIRKMQ